MIETVKRTTGSGEGMHRAYCHECGGFLWGTARSKHQSFWFNKAGADRAAQHHQDTHSEKPAMIGYDIAERAVMNSGFYQVVSSIPTIPKF